MFKRKPERTSGRKIGGTMTIFAGSAFVSVGIVVAAGLAGFIRVPFSLPLSEVGGFGLIVAALAVTVAGCVLVAIGI